MNPILQIPNITNPLGKHWQQPAKSKILLDEHNAVMSEYTLKQLLEYSASRPTGLYAGKMWRSVDREGINALHFCFELPEDPGAVYIRSLPILIL